MNPEKIIPIDSIMEKSAEITPTEEKEKIFEVIIKNDIIEDFADDLLEAGFEHEQVAEFEQEMENLDEESIKGVLSLPKELRLRNFPKMIELINNQTKSINEIVSGLAKTAKENGYTLGYHVSNNDILPDGNQWMVNGTEFDDRAMAYYSLDYKNIYRTHRNKYLYIVRAKVLEETEHKRDTSNNWGRAGTLDIIYKIDLPEVDEKVEEIFHDEHTKKSAA